VLLPLDRLLLDEVERAATTPQPPSVPFYIAKKVAQARVYSPADSARAALASGEFLKSGPPLLDETFEPPNSGPGPPT
jgi:hypothetical protein